MKKELQVTSARRSKVVTPSGFSGYDVCINSYVGCQIGCSYCYVRFFVKDDNKDWGEFVRTRDFIADKLPKELERGFFVVPDKNNKKHKVTLRNDETRLVIGTMTDPYQPIERKLRITRSVLTSLINAEHQLSKVGIFTRSPIIIDDLHLITQLPRKRVHFTIIPCEPDIVKLIEPISVRIDRRFKTVRQLKQAGVRCHVNVAPAIPFLCEDLTEYYAEQLAEAQVDEFFVDPMQAYGESFDALSSALSDKPIWKQVSSVLSDRDVYSEWKAGYMQSWFDAWAKVRHLSPHTLPIWSDHITHAWVNMNTGETMDRHNYGDDVE